MRCNRCGSREINEEPGDVKYPEQDKEWPVYQGPDEATLRARAHHDDVREFRAVATHMKKKMGWPWDKALPLMLRVLHDLDSFLFLKYGPDRGLDCSKPLSQKWEKQVEVTTWMLMEYRGDSDISNAVVSYIAEKDDTD